MTILHQIFCCVGKRNVSVQIPALLTESFDPTIGGKAVIVASVTDYKGGFMDRGIISFDYLIKVLFREMPLNPLGRSLIARLEYVNPFCEHLVI